MLDPDSLAWRSTRGQVGERSRPSARLGEDPNQAEIHEHLGTALYKSGRRFEARFAWSAALVTAEEDVAKRIQAKIASGLNSANAAP